MNPPDKPDTGEKSLKPKPSRQDEARRVIEEYADDLREIVKKLSTTPPKRD